MRSLMIFLGVAMCTAAHAADPSVDVDANGHITGQVTVAISADRVHQELHDVQRSDSLSAEVLRTTTVPVGPCLDVTRAVKGLWSPLTYTARRCPTESGWAETLVRSDDFSTYESEWRVVQVEGGTQIEYRVQTTPNMMVPTSVVRSRTKASVKTMLQQLVQRLSPARRHR
jgi:hypothetical protein